MDVYPSRRLLQASGGYGYITGSDQPDLDGRNYGTISVCMEYVLRQIRNATCEPVVSYQRGAWFGHQDQWVIRRR